MVIKTYSPKPLEITSTWRVIDAQGRVLGRLATEVARLLMGKHRPIYARHVNTGDFVVVINAAKVHVTGKKRWQKTYYRHTGYMGGLRETPLGKMLEEHPERVIQHAVKGMLPDNALGAQMLKRLKVYPGPEHPHEAQVKGGVRATRRTPRPRAPEGRVEAPAQAPAEAQPRTPTKTRAKATPKARAGERPKATAETRAREEPKPKAATTKRQRAEAKEQPPAAVQEESQVATPPVEEQEER